MADIPSSLAKMQNAEIESGSIESEILNTRIGANINGLIDVTDANDTAITSLENTGEVSGSDGTFDFLPTVTLVAATTVITPVGTNVLVVPSGFVFNPLCVDNDSGNEANNPPATEVNLVLKRNGTPIYSITAGVALFQSFGAVEYAGMTFLDTSASAGVPNTYSLEVENKSATDTLRSFSAKIDLMEF